MKRIVYLVAAATMILFTAGCSGSSAGSSPKTSKKPSTRSYKKETMKKQ